MSKKEEECVYECDDSCETHKHFCNCPKHKNKKKPKIIYKQSTSALLRELPDYVKDPKNYRKIELALLETMLGCHKAHSEIEKMSQCKKCTENMLVRRELMKKFGFRTSAHYLEWKKVHRKIESLQRMPKYNKK